MHPKSSRALSAAATARGIAVFIPRQVNNLRIETTSMDGRLVSVARTQGLQAGVHEFGAASLGTGNGLFVCRVFAGNEIATAIVLNVNKLSIGGK